METKELTVKVIESIKGRCPGIWLPDPGITAHACHECGLDAGVVEEIVRTTQSLMDGSRSGAGGLGAVFDALARQAHVSPAFRTALPGEALEAVVQETARKFVVCRCGAEMLKTGEPCPVCGTVPGFRCGWEGGV